MSNSIVGTVYEQVIERVIKASTTDFEENGVDSSTLEELKQGWQEKLSDLKIAAFPWDPQPEPPRQPPTVPSNVKTEPETSPAVSAPHQEHVNNFPNIPIKAEPGYNQPMSSYPQGPVNGYSAGYNGELAQQRAHALVAQRLGQAPHNMQMPPHAQHGQVPMQQRMMPGQPQNQQRPPPQAMQQRPPQPPVYPSQTDGAGDGLEDWKAFLAARRAGVDDSPEGRLAADQLLRTHIEARMADVDTGIGMTLSEMPKGKKRKALTRARQEQRLEASSSASALPGAARFDGDEEEENPEDAINSDLDDPEDELDAGEDGDDDMVDYMLCTYDKVQRVKNKWKCTLKDGILSTGKKEYLFHKANGEFEW